MQRRRKKNSHRSNMTALQRAKRLNKWTTKKKKKEIRIHENGRLHGLQITLNCTKLKVKAKTKNKLNVIIAICESAPKKKNIQ